eukprot:3121551-Amphidinium_carterae.3
MASYGQYSSLDILFYLQKELFPNKVNFQLQMLEEVHLMPTADKTVLSFNQAATFLDNWLHQKIEVAKNYNVSLEPQKVIAIVSRMMEMIRGPDGNVDATLSFDWHLHKRDLGDCWSGRMERL